MSEDKDLNGSEAERVGVRLLEVIKDEDSAGTVALDLLRASMTVFLVMLKTAPRHVQRDEFLSLMHYIAANPRIHIPVDLSALQTGLAN